MTAVAAYGRPSGPRGADDVTRTLGAPPIEPLRPAPDGRYDDGVVRVIHARGRAAGPPVQAWSSAGQVVVRHALDTVDDDLSELLAEALWPYTRDHDVFARAFTGVVVTSDRDPVTAWERFYRASLDRLADTAHSGYVEVYRHALALLPRTGVLDLGAGFGFLALHLAAAGVPVWTSDCDAGSTRLLAAMSRRLELPVEVLTPQEAAGLPAASVDAVALLHVLEHVDADTGGALLQEALRVARSRVVVAVPYEDEPTAMFGHLRALGADDLAAFAEPARRAGWHVDIHEHHGGWLVLDRADRRSPAPAGGHLLFEGDPS